MFGSSGEWLERPEAFDAPRWASRDPIWATAPAAPPGGRGPFRFYKDRRVSIASFDAPLAPLLDSISIAGARARRKRPRVDGIPYETYHSGARFVACFLGQGVYAADMGTTPFSWSWGTPWTCWSGSPRSPTQSVQTTCAPWRRCPRQVRRATPDGNWRWRPCE